MNEKDERWIEAIAAVYWCAILLACAAVLGAVYAVGSLIVGDR